MAKATSSLVVPIIFLVIFALVEQNMGCNDYDVGGNGCDHCRLRCLKYYPPTRKAELEKAKDEFISFLKRISRSRSQSYLGAYVVSRSGVCTSPRN
ncbi:unnamed protein product [Arabidopsis lyrata]|nr:unnamed protein product [Arabidopsis lyrata]